MKIIDTQQGSSEWLETRLGHFTASTMGDLVKAGARGQRLKATDTLINQLCAERMTGTVDDGFTAYTTERGKELEASARVEYEFQTERTVDEIGFALHDSIKWLGMSPDGLVGVDGGVEIKCPVDLKKHLSAIQSNAHAEEYKWQVQTCLFVSGRKWWDVCSYDPRFSAQGKQLVICRVLPDPEMHEQIEAAVHAGNREIEKILS